MELGDNGAQASRPHRVLHVIVHDFLQPRGNVPLAHPEVPRHQHTERKAPAREQPIPPLVKRGLRPSDTAASMPAHKDGPLCLAGARVATGAAGGQVRTCPCPSREAGYEVRPEWRQVTTADG